MFKTPYRELPPPVVLKSEKNKGYIYGEKHDGWIIWASQQSVPHGTFRHREWAMVPFGFQGTKNLIMKLNTHISTARRWNLIRWMNKNAYNYDELNWKDIKNFFKYHNRPGVQFPAGGTVCLIWQVGLGGTWCLATRYGVVEGLHVSIVEDVEWQLRCGLLIGMIWFAGEDYVPQRGSSISKLMRGVTVHDWEDVDIMIWGQAESYPSRAGKYLLIAGEKWKVLRDYVGKLRVGTKDVISDRMYFSGRQAWRNFCEDSVNKGWHMLYQTRNGVRFQTGMMRKYKTQAEYDELFKKVRQ